MPPSRSLGNNEVGDAGAAALGEALKDNSTLTTLGCVLSGVEVGDRGASVGTCASLGSHKTAFATEPACGATKSATRALWRSGRRSQSTLR